MIVSLYKLPDRIRISIVMFGLYIIILTLFRIVFFLFFFEEMRKLPPEFLFKSIFIGLRFDARLAIMIVLPFLLLSMLPLFNRKSFQKAWKSYWFTTLAIVLCIYIADIGYYSYLNTRLDASILGLAKNFFISVNMIWETYPVIPFIFLIAIFLWFLLIVIDKVHTIITSPQNMMSNRNSAIIHFLIILLFLGIGYGKWSRYPFRWSDAFYSTNHSANQLAINPVLYFLNTWTRVSETYDIKKVKQFYPIMSDFLNVDNPNINNLNFSRSFKQKISSRKQPNIIIILLETFPAFKCGILGNPLNPTPNFDKLARESILFTRFFVPKLSTAASIFCTVTGLPDMAVVNKSSTRDPFAINQDIFLNQLKGYKKHFFMGGSANWGDINGFLNNNVDDIIIHEEDSYDIPETNAWGISDYHLLQETHAVLSKETQPFISLVLTAGHHRPYTIPDNIPGFEKSGFTPEHKNYSFGENEFYSFKFMDFSLGQFMKNAREADYFDNTLFVVFGDHGSFGYHLNKSHGDLTIHEYHVPLIFYGPGLNISPSVYKKVASEIDIFPTIFSLLNIPYENNSIGRNIFSANNEPLAFLFSAATQRYALLSDSHLIIHSSYPESYKIFNPWDLSTTPKELAINKKTELLVNISEGIFETARYLRYIKNNKNDF